MTPTTNVDLLLESLRWDVDRKVVNCFGEHVWLKAVYEGGKRIGITDCCEVDSPCPWHAALSKRTDCDRGQGEHGRA